jgi:phage terminase Nu1 subunit (DNA packaging protein)
MPTNSGERVFTSWKDIASFFGKGVRTVQRWERKFGLPISRPTAAKNVVLATESELREWIRRSSSQLSGDDGTLAIDKNAHHDGNGDGLVTLSARLKRLEDDTARLARIVATFSERIDELSSKVPIGIVHASGTIVKSSSSKPVAARK